MRATILLLLGLIPFTLGQICPPPEVLFPCECQTRLYSYIQCENIKEAFNLKELLDNASSFITDPDFVFDELRISLTPLLEIEEGAVEHLKFKLVAIANNQKLGYISPRAFNASRNITRELDLRWNNITNRSPRETDIFEFISSFENLQIVNLVNNHLTSIPDNALQNLKLLDMAAFDDNEISHIGSHAFLGAPKLTWLGLAFNFVPSAGLPASAFEGLSHSVDVDMRFNGMSFMEQNSFQELLDSAANVYIGGTACYPDGTCVHQRFHCDERADWLCDREESYRPILDGFYCKLENGVFDNVWEYCAGRD